MTSTNPHSEICDTEKKLEESEAISKDSKHHSVNDNEVVTKTDPIACAQPDESISKSSGNLESDGNSILNSVQAVDDLSSIEKTGGDSEPIIKVPKPLCADYRSDSDSESLDSECDSTASTSSITETSSDGDSSDSDATEKKTKQPCEKKGQKDVSMSELPPIEDLKISVPENACLEVGTVSSIVDTLVVVESYKGTAALDIDTVLFLDNGNRTLGRVFDILGPITEPVYTVRFNSQDQIKNLGIEKGLKVYYAPETQHTMFVFLSEVLKNRGSDASWKDNIEAPSEFQDFSDDEEERLHKNKMREPTGENTCSKEPNKSRKRSFSKIKKPPGFIQPSRFRPPDGQGRPNYPGSLSANQFVSAFPRPHSGPQNPPFPFGVPPPYPGTNIMNPPHMYYPARFSGPPFPTFGGLPFMNRNFHQPFHQQRSPGFPQGFGGGWGKPAFRPPPPPPPPDNAQNEK